MKNQERNQRKKYRKNVRDDTETGRNGWILNKSDKPREENTFILLVLIILPEFVSQLFSFILISSYAH